MNLYSLSLFFCGKIFLVKLSSKFVNFVFGFLFIFLLVSWLKSFYSFSLFLMKYKTFSVIWIKFFFKDNCKSSQQKYFVLYTLHTKNINLYKNNSLLNLKATPESNKQLFFKRINYTNQQFFSTNKHSLQLIEKRTKWARSHSRSCTKSWGKSTLNFSMKTPKLKMMLNILTKVKLQKKKVLKELEQKY